MKQCRIFILAAALGISSTAFASGPSSIFGQEMARTINDGDVQFDLMGSGNTHLRMGAFDGELIFNVSASNAQYKKSTSENFAVYGGLGITTMATSTTTLVIGAAYTSTQDNMFFNLNPVITSSAGTTSINVGLGAFMPLTTGKSVRGKVLAGLAVDLPVSPSSNSTILLGLRWEVKPNLTLEAGLYNTGTGLQFPGLFRINLAL